MCTRQPRPQALTHWLSLAQIYAALAIVLNYVFVCTATPCEVLVWHRRWSKEGKRFREHASRRELLQSQREAAARTDANVADDGAAPPSAGDTDDASAPVAAAATLDGDTTSGAADDAAASVPGTANLDADVDAVDAVATTDTTDDVVQPNPDDETKDATEDGAVAANGDAAADDASAPQGADADEQAADTDVAQVDSAAAADGADTGAVDTGAGDLVDVSLTGTPVNLHSTANGSDSEAKDDAAADATDGAAPVAVMGAAPTPDSEPAKSAADEQPRQHLSRVERFFRDRYAWW